MPLIIPSLSCKVGHRSASQLKRFLHSRYENFQRVSKLFQPAQAVKKAVRDGDVSSKSLELLTGAGYIRQSSSGIFHLLPLCLRVLDKMAAAIDAEMAAIGASKMAMPSLVRERLWEQSGRLEKMGAELMTVRERSGHRLVLSPTHEEAVSQLVGALSPISGRQLPLRLYQTTAKFRDERRPRFGLLRCKEFLMNDLYTFDATEACARDTYNEVTEAYGALFRRLGVPAVRVRGDSGVMGGGLSHEFHVLSAAGEDSVWVRHGCQHLHCPAAVNVQVDGDPRTCSACGHSVHRHTGIEVGHTFLLGCTYSEVFGATSASATGDARQPLHMGCYGIGVTRLLAAALEVAASDTEEIRWPPAMAPYRLCAIPPKAGSREASANDWTWRMISELSEQPSLRGDLLVDDRDHLTIGQRVREARRSGHACLLVFGREAVSGRAELLRGGHSSVLDEAELVDKVANMVDGS